MGISSRTWGRTRGAKWAAITLGGFGLGGVGGVCTVCKGLAIGV